MTAGGFFAIGEQVTYRVGFTLPDVLWQNFTTAPGQTYVLSFFAIFGVGGLTGLFLGALLVC